MLDTARVCWHTYISTLKAICGFKVFILYKLSCFSMQILNHKSLSSKMEVFHDFAYLSFPLACSVKQDPTGCMGEAEFGYSWHAHLLLLVEKSELLSFLAHLSYLWYIYCYERCWRYFCKKLQDGLLAEGWRGAYKTAVEDGKHSIHLYSNCRLHSSADEIIINIGVRAREVKVSP